MDSRVGRFGSYRESFRVSACWSVDAPPALLGHLLFNANRGSGQPARQCTSVWKREAEICVAGNLMVSSKREAGRSGFEPVTGV